MPADSSSYQRSIDQAARTLAAANADWQRIADQIEGVRNRLATEQIDILDNNSKPTGQKRIRTASEVDYELSQSAQTKELSQQLDTAAKRANQSEQAYQDAIQLSDKAQTDAKQFLPAGTPRTRLDTTSGNVLVSVTEVADGNGGWTVQPDSVKRVDVAGVPGANTPTKITAPSTDEFIVSMKPDGSLIKEKNPNYVAGQTGGPTAVPVSEFIYQNGEIKPNPAYRPPAAEINTTAEKINDPNHPGQMMRNPNYKSPDEGLTTGQRQVDVAVGSNAEATSAAALNTAQATAQKTLLDYQTAQANFDALTPEMRSQAAQADLAAKKLLVTQAQENLQLAQDAHQTILDQGKATLAGTQATTEGTQASTAATLATTQKGLLGNLYGLMEQGKQIADMIRSGQIKGPDAEAQAHKMLQDRIQAAIAGTTPAEALTSAGTMSTTQRGQDYSLAGTQTSNYGSGFGNALTTFSKLNDTTPVGSDAAGKGFIASMNMLQNGLRSFAPAPDATNSALIRQLAGLGGVGAAAAPAAPGAVAPITINIGGSGSGQGATLPSGGPAVPPMLAAGLAGTNADPRFAGSPAAAPAMLNAGTPVMPNHVSDLWANDPNLNPGAQAATGAVDRTSVGLGGM